MRFLLFQKKKCKITPKCVEANDHTNVNIWNYTSGDAGGIFVGGVALWSIHNRSNFQICTDRIFIFMCDISCIFWLTFFQNYDRLNL